MRFFFKKKNVFEFYCITLKKKKTHVFELGYGGGLKLLYCGG